MPRELDRDTRQIYELVGRMQVMMTIYLRNSADPFGGDNYAGKNSELELPLLAKEFSSLLDSARIKQQKKLAPALARIHTKWVFLSPRLIDSQQASIPYIVDLYGRQIIDLLLATVNQ
jgi:hypothetical protein